MTDSANRQNPALSLQPRWLALVAMPAGAAAGPVGPLGPVGPDWLTLAILAVLLLFSLLYVLWLHWQRVRLRADVAHSTRELENREQLLRALADSASAGIFMVQGDHFEFVNPAMTAITGYPEEDLLQIGFPRLIHPADRSLVRRRARMRRSGEDVPDHYRIRIVTRGGSTRWVELSVSAVPLNGITVTAGTCLDITEHKDLERDLEAEGRFNRLIADTSADFANAHRSNIDARINRMLQQFASHLGADRAYLFRYSSDQSRETNTHEWCAPGVAPAIQDLQDVDLKEIPWLAEQQRQMLESNRPFIWQDTEKVPAASSPDRALLQTQGIRSMMLIPVNNNDAFCGFFGFDSLRPREWPESTAGQLQIVAYLLSEAMASIEQEAALTRESLTDPLTGLYNRRYLDLKSPEWLAAARDNSQLALALFDIDHFKPFNDTHGHLAGDQLLRQLGETLRRGSRDNDILVRYGGEEFLLAMSGTPRAEAEQVIQRLLEDIRQQEYRWEDNTSHISISVGMAFSEEIPTAELTLQNLLDRADKRLYAAKRAGRDRLISVDQDPDSP